MFASVIASVVKSVRFTVRAIRTLTHRSPWFTAAAILALFVAW